MKYLFSSVLGLMFLATANSQTVKASLGPGSASTRIIIYLTCTPAAAVGASVSTLQYDVAIPASIVPIPTLSIVGTPAIGSGFTVQPPYVEDGFLHYEIYTPNTFAVNVGTTDSPAMELQFSGGPVTPNNVSLITLPGGVLIQVMLCFYVQA
ncbi:MAG: hypothetical protein IPP73_19270 [Chitinophagaceae bacterium]|nr:hypothetical protein [Chitinophagaceae bacterium]